MMAENTSVSFAPGTAPIKSEFVLHKATRAVVDDDAAEKGTSHTTVRPADGDGGEDAAGASTPGGARRNKRDKKDDKKKNKGANKGRRWTKVHDDLNLCWRLAAGKACEFGSECRFTHNIPAYLSQKPRDIHFPRPQELSSEPPFCLAEATLNDELSTGLDGSLDIMTTCPVFEETGACRHGYKCRFLGGHATRGEDGSISLLLDGERQARSAVTAAELNTLESSTLKLIRTKKFPRPLSDAYLREIQANPQTKLDEAEIEHVQHGQILVSEPEQDVSMHSQEDIMTPTEPVPTQTIEPIPSNQPGEPERQREFIAQQDTPDVPLRTSEKKRLHWKGLTYLAPLTTVGNLPFRRLCASLGADITCGEMGLATSFLSASKEEWSLVRRHPSERTFGVQLAGSKPATLVPAAEMVGNICAGGLDFVDLNCGCPIDLVFKAGSGSALLESTGRLSKSLIGMSRVLGEIPLTVKLRTGIRDGHNVAHKLMPRVLEWGVSAMTLHGRTRQQRYQKLADWDYIKQCVQAVRAREEEESLPSIPIFGGGDAFSSQDYWEKVEASGVDGCMVARGALIKPWIFTEIKERREWDISARERLDLVRRFAEFGLSHFGTDTAGVNTTRRYLCEALSFQHRYVPIGLLEVLPGRINDRPPAFRGRNELETLLASEDSRDWVKISEMFLGPAPETWSFMPKHKSNAYESQG